MAAAHVLLLAALCASTSAYDYVEDIGNVYATNSSISETIYELPDDFLIGAASAAFQIEGAWNRSGKGASIWDVFLHARPTWDQGDVACDSYDLYETDVTLLKNLKVNTYRFSMSWPRLLPNGTTDYVDSAGVAYYNNLIDLLLNHSITPVVTMYHWDLPEALEKTGGWAGNSSIQDYFLDYANFLFETFGDRVTWWITLNEPISFCTFGYEDGVNSTEENSPGVGIYKCAYNLLLAHAKVYDSYYNNFTDQGGQVGITNEIDSAEPLNHTSSTDLDAAERYMVFHYAFFVDPLVYGDWPAVMVEAIAANSAILGYNSSRLPSFTSEEQELLAGSLDFLGTNHYVACTATPTEFSVCDNFTASYDNDVGVTTATPSNYSLGYWWSTKTPWGFRRVLNWVGDRYLNIPIYVTENGYNGDTAEGLKDYNRIAFLSTYMRSMLTAINTDDINVIGYMVWSLLDNLEWLNGYKMRFGMHYVDFTSSTRKRRAKKSATYFKNVMRTNKVTYYAYPSSS